MLWRIDTGGRPVLRTVTVDKGVDGIAAGAGAIWASNSLSGTVARIHPAHEPGDHQDRRGQHAALGHGGRRARLGGRRGRRGPAVPPAGSLRAGSPVTPLRTSACGPALTGADGRADLLLVAELPLQGSAQAGAQPMADAIAFVLREHRFRAGRFRLALQTCDDSTAQGALPFDSGKCRSNAKAEVADRSVVGVIGPMHSGCAFEMLPLLNGAPGGPIAVLSPTNTAKPLVRRDPADPAGQLAHLHPAGRQGYARIMPTEDYESAAMAMFAKRLGGPVFYLEDAFTDHGPYERWFRYSAHRVGLGVSGAGVWDPAARHYRRLAARVRASGARTVVLFGSLVVNGGQVIRDLRAALGPRVRILAYSGFTPLTALFTDAGPAAPRRLRLPGRAAARPPEPGRAALPARLRRHAAGWPRHLLRRLRGRRDRGDARRDRPLGRDARVGQPAADGDAAARQRRSAPSPSTGAASRARPSSRSCVRSVT